MLLSFAHTKEESYSAELDTDNIFDATVFFNPVHPVILSKIIGLRLRSFSCGKLHLLRIDKIGTIDSLTALAGCYKIVANMLVYDFFG